MAVLRARDTSNREPERYPPVVLEPRTAVDEHWLQNDLMNLVSAVIQRWQQPSASTASFRDLQAAPVYMVGPSCVPIGENCFGDNWDASYQLYGPGPKSLDDREVYAIAGTLGTETSHEGEPANATYVGLSINVMPWSKGVANLSDKNLKGTADGYAVQVNNTSKFYLYYFTRDCKGLEYLTDGHCLSLDETLIPPEDWVSFAVRDYVRPGTQRGPDPSKVLPSMMIKLQKP